MFPKNLKSPTISLLVLIHSAKRAFPVCVILFIYLAVFILFTLSLGVHGRSFCVKIMRVK